MNELNWTLGHRRFVFLGYILCMMCCLFACDDKATPPRPAQEGPTPVTSEQKEVDNAQDADTLTEDELDAYRQEIGDLSPNELIAKARSNASEIKLSAKAIARHLANNNTEEAEKIAADLKKIMKKNEIVVNIITLRLLSGEFPKEQSSTIKDLISEMTEALELAETVNNVAIKLTEEK